MYYIKYIIFVRLHTHKACVSVFINVLFTCYKALVRLSMRMLFIYICVCATFNENETLAFVSSTEFPFCHLSQMSSSDKILTNAFQYILRVIVC